MRARVLTPCGHPATEQARRLFYLARTEPKGSVGILPAPRCALTHSWRIYLPRARCVDGPSQTSRTGGGAACGSSAVASDAPPRRLKHSRAPGIKSGIEPLDQFGEHSIAKRLCPLGCLTVVPAEPRDFCRRVLTSGSRSSPSFSTRGVCDPGKRSKTTSWSKGPPHSGDVLAPIQE